MPSPAKPQTESFEGRDGRILFHQVRRMVAKWRAEQTNGFVLGPNDAPILVGTGRIHAALVYVSNHGIHIGRGTLDEVDALVIVRGEGQWEAKLEKWDGMFVVPRDEFEIVRESFSINVVDGVPVDAATDERLTAVTQVLQVVAPRPTKRNRLPSRVGPWDPKRLGPFGDELALRSYINDAMSRIMASAHYDWTLFSWRLLDTDDGRRWQLAVPHKNGGRPLLLKPERRRPRGSSEQVWDAIRGRSEARSRTGAHSDASDWLLERTEHPLAAAQVHGWDH